MFSLISCDSEQTPDEVTQGFWSQIIANKLDRAKQYCSVPSQQLPAIEGDKLSADSLSYGKIVIDGDQSTVDVQISLSSGKVLSIVTYLNKQSNGWKVDCNRTSAALNGNQAFKDFFNNLNELGKNFNEQLKQQLPIIEKGIESFGQELQQQMEEFGNELKKSMPKKEIEPYEETI